MIGDRFIFLIVCSIVSCLPSNNWVTELKTSKTSLVIEPSLTSSNQVQIKAKNLLFTLNCSSKNHVTHHDATVKLLRHNSLSRLLNVKEDVFGYTTTLISDRLIENNDNNLDSTTSEKSLKISKRWSLLGMAITFSGSLILLRLLFIPTSKKVSPTSVKSAVKQRVSKVIKHEAQLNNEDHELLDYSLLDSADIGESEIISLPSTQCRSISSHRQTTSANTLSSKLIPLDGRRDKHGARLSRGSMGVKKLPVNSSDDEQYLNQVSSENFELTNRLTILNSGTKADVVLELIKHLQQTDRDSRREAIWGLAEIGDSRGIEPLARILPQVNATDRNLVLNAIAQITQRSLKLINVHLLATLDDASPEIKQSTIRDLTTLYEFVAPITKQIARMQVDRDVGVQQTAKVASERLNLCYFPCLFDDCPNAGDQDLNSNGNSDQTS